MFNTALHLADWLRSQDIDPDHVTLTMACRDRDTAERIRAAVMREADNMEGMLVRDKVPAPAGAVVTVNGLRVAAAFPRPCMWGPPGATCLPALKP